MAHIIGIIQVKGGAGRSTVATNLAGLIAKSGNRVALVDCDMPQGTAAAWASIRASEGRGDVGIATAADHTELVAQVQRLDADHDYLILDCPPRIAEMTKAALVLSHLCLVPVAPSAADIWATSDLLPTIDAAKAVKPETDARIVWNRFRASTRLAQELSAAAGKELGLKSLSAKLGYRVAYAEAMARGLTAQEWTDRKAKDELAALAGEVGKILKAKDK